MSIDYDEIIKRAFQRKESLKKFAEVMQQMPEQMATYCRFCDYLIELRDSIALLDAEARMMLGEENLHPLRNAIQAFMKPGNDLTNKNGYVAKTQHEAMEALVALTK